MSEKIPFEVAKRDFKKLPDELSRKETKAEKIARKRRESIPLEVEEARILGLQHLNKSADRRLYTRPINRQAAKELKSRTT